MANFSQDAHWRDSARNAKFFIVDAKAVFPVFLFILNISWWTFSILIVSILFFSIIEKFGFTLPVFWRWIKSFIAGPVKNSSPWWLE
jgi:intracellular multiplication protein IcmT